MFKYKTEKEIGELSDYQREKYFDEKRIHEENQAKELAKQAAKDAVAEASKDFDTKLEQVKLDAKADAEAQVKAKEESLNEKFEAMEKAWKDTSVTHSRTQKAKAMSEYIEAKLSTDEGEQMLKDFAAGAKFKFNTDVEFNSKAVFATGVDTVAPDMTGIVRNSFGRIHARNVISVYPTVSNLITFLRLTPTTGTSIGKTAEGAQKPELEYDKLVVKVPVEKLAGYITFTEESLDDIVGLRSWLANELPNAYLKVEDMYIFKDATYGINTLATAFVPSTESNSWDILLSAMAQLEEGDNYASAVFLSPKGKAELYKNKDIINGLYTYPIVMGDRYNLSIAGIPIYSTNIFTGLEFLIGDFSSSSVTYHQRQAMNIRYSEEHADNFIKNLVTVLIEGRGAIAVRKPQAFVKGNLIASKPIVAPAP